MPAAVKTIQVHLMAPTSGKVLTLRSLGVAYTGAVNRCREAIEYWDGFRDDPLTRNSLRILCYATLRTTFGLPAQLAVFALDDAWAGRNDPCARVRAVGLPFNIPRSGNLGTTKRGNPVVRCRTQTQRLAVPIRRDGASRRLVEHLRDGWTTMFFRIEERDDGWRVSFVLRKEVPERPTTGVVGVDVGSRTLAAISVVGRDGRVGRQFYFGQDVAVVQQRILRRRAVLQSHADQGSRKAARKLEELRGYERDFTTTRCYQVAHEIVRLAEDHSCSIAIEDLTNLRDSRLTRQANRTVKRLPYHQIRAALESVAAQSGDPVVAVPAQNTSRMCPRCGFVAKENRDGASFRCGKCSRGCNADRNASVNVAHRAMSLERHEASDISLQAEAGHQISSDRGRVNGLAWNHDGGARSCPRHARLPEFTPPASAGGS